MPRGLGRPSFLHRRRGAGSGRDDAAAAAPARPLDPDSAPVGPPLLLPTAIIRQILFEATELTPAWALPRATTPAAIVAPPSVPEAKPVQRTRRSRASTTPKTAPKPTTSGARPVDASGAAVAPKPRRSRRAKGDA
jgi:hypothetical protein